MLQGMRAWIHGTANHEQSTRMRALRQAVRRVLQGMRAWWQSMRGALQGMRVLQGVTSCCQLQLRLPSREGLVYRATHCPDRIVSECVHGGCWGWQGWSGGGSGK